MTSITDVLEMHAQGLKLSEFMREVIDQGIEGCKESYKGDSPGRKMKREGAVAGFEACREADSLDELHDVLRKAREQGRGKFEDDDYWWYRTYQAEVEWVCNVVSSLFHLLGSDLKLVTPTACGVMQANRIIQKLKRGAVVG